MRTSSPATTSAVLCGLDWDGGLDVSVALDWSTINRVGVNTPVVTVFDVVAL